MDQHRNGRKLHAIILESVEYGFEDGQRLRIWMCNAYRDTFDFRLCDQEFESRKNALGVSFVIKKYVSANNRHPKVARHSFGDAVGRGTTVNEEEVAARANRFH